MNPDQLARLEEERDFLLRSLEDLEREHAAGDVEDDDHRTLRDDYTARTAEVLRAIEAGRAALPGRRALDPRRLVAGVVAAGVLVTGIYVLLTRSVEPKDTAGPQAATVADLCPPGPGTDLNTLLVDARTALASDPSCALTLYRSVLDTDPTNVEGRTYLGWVIASDALRSGLQGEDLRSRGEVALQLIDSARDLAPDYVDAQCFTAIVRFRFLDDAVGAKDPLDRCRAGRLPAEVAPLVEQLGTQIDAALSGS